MTADKGYFMSEVAGHEPPLPSFEHAIGELGAEQKFASLAAKEAKNASDEAKIANEEAEVVSEIAATAKDYLTEVTRWLEIDYIGDHIGKDITLETSQTFVEQAQGGYSWSGRLDKDNTYVVGTIRGIEIVDTAEVTNTPRRAEHYYEKYEVCIILEYGEGNDRELVPLTALINPPEL